MRQRELARRLTSEAADEDETRDTDERTETKWDESKLVFSWIYNTTYKYIFRAMYATCQARETGGIRNREKAVESVGMCYGKEAGMFWSFLRLNYADALHRFWVLSSRRV